MNTPPPVSGSMRILVADQREQCIVIEKSLSVLGYFRVCSVESFRELTVLTHYSPSQYDRFDLLILNAEVLCGAGINVLDFCVNNARLKHVLIYGMSCEHGVGQTIAEQEHHQVRSVATISHKALLDFLSVIDGDLQNKD